MSFRLLAVAILIAVPSTAHSDALPRGFANLADIDPTIVQDIRYFASNNFLGRKVAGYDADNCILTEIAARALAKAQAPLAKSGFGLKVFDCYRPARAVAEFATWANTSDNSKGNAYFFPTIPKNRLFALGYIAARSNHSAGSTVDVGLIRRPQSNGIPTTTSNTAQPSGAEPAKDGPVASTSETGSNPVSCIMRSSNPGDAEMGTDFDCFHPNSNYSSQDVSVAALKNRALLRTVMVAAGFEPYDKEWWHFRLKDEPFPKQAFDFPVTGRGDSATRGR